MKLTLVSDKISSRKIRYICGRGQVSMWSDHLWVSFVAFTRRFLRTANLKLGYKLHDFPLKFFSHRNYRRRHVKATFGGSYVVDATVIWGFLAKLEVRGAVSRGENDRYRESFYRFNGDISKLDRGLTSYYVFHSADNHNDTIIIIYLKKIMINWFFSLHLWLYFNMNSNREL